MSLVASSPLVNEHYAPALVREPVIHIAPAPAIPIEVHLRDEEPATGVDRLDMSHMPSATCPLCPAAEHDARIGRRLHAHPIAAIGSAGWPFARITQIGQVLVAPLELRPPRAL